MAIEVFLFIILISSVLLYSPVGRVIVEHILNKNRKELDYFELKTKYNELANKIAQQEQDINQLREMVIFYENKLPKNLINTENTDYNSQKINFEKNLKIEE